MKEYVTERFDKQITLAAYVGEKNSREVLKGNIVPGGGETVSAVVLFADVMGFTRLSNELPSAKDARTVCADAFQRVAIGLKAAHLERHFNGFDTSSSMYIIE